MEPGLIGGLAGGVVGIAGGAFGTYLGIKHTHGPREREFMIRVSAVGWALALAFLAGLMLLPRPYGWFLWVPYGIGLSFGARWVSRKQMQIRAAEGAPAPPSNA